ncbi:MAG: hypothetical protein HUU56_10195 [Bdellovibrionaceae bacterium]|nr:hypothetical protein [Pseudobdellovibrionaceae bacterium]
MLIPEKSKMSSRDGFITVPKGTPYGSSVKACDWQADLATEAGYKVVP